MQIENIDEGNVVRLLLEGRFDFDTHRDFRSACRECLIHPTAQEIVIDFSRVDYLDSAALGLLLLLQEKATAKGKKVALENLSGSVEQVIKIANLDKYMDAR